MPRKERCKRLRAKQLNEAASSTLKLSRFGFAKDSGNSSQTQDSNNSTTKLDAEDFSSHSHESDVPDIGTIKNNEKPPDLSFTQQQSTFTEKLASDLPQEMNQIQSLEPTIVDHESETDISEPSFVVTSASPIANRSSVYRQSRSRRHLHQ